MFHVKIFTVLCFVNIPMHHSEASLGQGFKININIIVLPTPPPSRQSALVLLLAMCSLGKPELRVHPGRMAVAPVGQWRRRAWKTGWEKEKGEEAKRDEHTPGRVQRRRSDCVGGFPARYWILCTSHD